MLGLDGQSTDANNQNSTYQTTLTLLAHKPQEQAASPSQPLSRTELPVQKVTDLEKDKTQAAHPIPPQFAQAMRLIDPLEKARDTVKRLEDQNLKFQELVTQLKKEDAFFEELYQGYNEFYPAILRGEQHNYNLPTGDKIKEHEAWCKAQLFEIERSPQREHIKYLRALIFLLNGTYKEENILNKDAAVYNLTTCPLELLTKLVNAKNYIAMLSALSSEDRNSYCALLQKQIATYTQTLATCDRDLTWLRSGQAKIAEPESLLHDVEHKKKRLETLLPFVKEQLWLLKNEYRTRENLVVNISTCPEEKLARIFQDRYIIRQFKNFDYLDTQAFLTFLGNALQSQEALVAKMQMKKEFINQVLQRITDFRTSDVLCSKVKPCLVQQQTSAPNP